MRRAVGVVITAALTAGSCFTTAATSGSPSAIAVGTCLQAKSTSCSSPIRDAATDG
jgi:hypothetical protein